VEKFIRIPTSEDRSYITFLSQNVWRLAISQPQRNRLMEIGQEKILPFIQETLKRIQTLEKVAERPLFDRITDDDLNIKAIWCPSAPGNWFNAWKKDRYEHVPYTKWWDRTQIIESLRTSQIIGNLRNDNGPMIIYNGRPDENNSLRKAIKYGGYRSKILEEKLYFIDTNMENKYNSLEQVRNLKLPERKLQPGDSLGIVVRPGQALRLLHFLNNSKNGFPENVRIKIFPVKTGSEGLPHHYILETCGLLYYRFTSGDAAENPYPYVV
jgi:hypothetical protein